MNELRGKADVKIMLPETKPAAAASTEAKPADTAPAAASAQRLLLLPRQPLSKPAFIYSPLPPWLTGILDINSNNFYGVAIIFIAAGAFYETRMERVSH